MEIFLHTEKPLKGSNFIVCVELQLNGRGNGVTGL